MVKRYAKDDSNFRMENNRASIVPKCPEVKLERDVLQAINLRNLEKTHPEVWEEIIQVLKRHNIEI